jgi:acetoin utilization deacetylase AcuC-like enzyme
VKPLVISHPACFLHRNSAGHPERPARIEAVLIGARAWGGEVDEREAPMATPEQLALVHDPTYVAAIEEFCREGGGELDPDTGAVPGTWEAACRAAGAGLLAIDAIRAGASPVAFLAIRPPGHHAHAARALGFCIFNNIAISAERLVSEGSRVAIVDFDVHHGDGTQATFGSRSDVLYVSLHEYPFYPGSGWLEEIGQGQGHGRTVNIPLPPGTAGDAVERVFEQIIVPVVSEFDPDWILVSAGYDGHRADPLADWVLEADDYGRIARHLSRFDRPVVYFLEGGYEYDALVASAASTLRGACGNDFPAPTGKSPEAVMDMVQAAAVQAAKIWHNVQAG